MEDKCGGWALPPAPVAAAGSMCHLLSGEEPLKRRLARWSCVSPYSDLLRYPKQPCTSPTTFSFSSDSELATIPTNVWGSAHDTQQDVERQLFSLHWNLYPLSIHGEIDFHGASEAIITVQNLRLQNYFFQWGWWPQKPSSPWNFFSQNFTLVSWTS